MDGARGNLWISFIKDYSLPLQIKSFGWKILKRYLLIIECPLRYVIETALHWPNTCLQSIFFSCMCKMPCRPAILTMCVSNVQWTSYGVYSYSRHPNCVSTTPITAMGCRQCLSLIVVQLKGKHCRKVIGIFLIFFSLKDINLGAYLPPK